MTETTITAAPETGDHDERYRPEPVPSTPGEKFAEGVIGDVETLARRLKRQFPDAYADPEVADALNSLEGQAKALAEARLIGLEDVVGIGDLARIVGSDRQSVVAKMGRRGAPQGYRLTAGQVWVRGDALAFLRSRLKPGRPRGPRHSDAVTADAVTARAGRR